MSPSVCCSLIANVAPYLLQLHGKCHRLTVAAPLQMPHSVCCSYISNFTLYLFAAPLKMLYYVCCSTIANATLYLMQLNCKWQTICTSAIANSHSARCSFIANVTLSLFQLHFKFDTLSVAARLKMPYSVYFKTIANATQFVSCTLIANVTLCLMQSISIVTLYLVQLPCTCHNLSVAELLHMSHSF